MGLENLIKALKIVVPKAPRIYLVLGGEGPLKRDLEALAKDLELDERMSFVDFVPEDQLPRYYRMADLFILPTRELEGFGLVTLESLASGVPVLGTPVGGTTEILGRLDSAYLFADTSPESLAELILEKYRIIAKNPLKWRAQGLACRQFVEKHYSWEINVNVLEEFIYEVSGSLLQNTPSRVNQSG
jgi:glycosyltransferase involved in cell wall biosynthesis